MRPWAKWMVNHNMRYVLCAIPLVLFPLYLLDFMKHAFALAFKDMKHDIGRILNYKDERKPT